MKNSAFSLSYNALGRHGVGCIRGDEPLLIGEWCPCGTVVRFRCANCNHPLLVGELVPDDNVRDEEECEHWLAWSKDAHHEEDSRRYEINPMQP